MIAQPNLPNLADFNAAFEREAYPNLRVSKLHNGIHCASTETAFPELFPHVY